MIDNIYEEIGSTNRTTRNIRKALNTSLLKKYNINNKDITNEILKIHGIDDSKFDFIGYVNKVINEKLSDISIDSNSNKNEKTVAGIQQEALSPVKKAVGYDYLYRKMKSLYGKAEAKRLSGEMYDLSLGLSDSTNILIPYCWAFDASKIVTIGREFGQLHSKPAKRVSSYISALCETIHQMSSHLAGAIAISTFFLDIAHLSLYKEKYDLRDLKTNKQFRKKVENEMQQFVHSVNHLSRNGIESSFTNVSIFDKIKLFTLVKELNWYFPFSELPIEHPTLETEEEKNEFYYGYLVEYITEIQNIFLDFFDKGDPLKGGAPYRFPVVTLNISKTKNDKIEDASFLRGVCKREIYRYNIFASEGNKLASCCFDKDQKILVRFSNTKPMLLTFEEAFEISRKEGGNPKIYHNGTWSLYKRTEVEYNDNYYKIITANNKEIIITKDHLNPCLSGDKITEDLTVDDYLLFNNLILDSVVEKDLKLTYEQGYMIGCYLGDGSRAFGVKGQLSYSLNVNCYDKIKNIIDIALQQLGIDRKMSLSSIYNNVYPATVSSKEACTFIKTWVIGKDAVSKKLNLEVLLQSVPFRRGILDGWYETDGGNNNRCYSVSKELIDCMEVLCSTLGLNTCIDINDRMNEPVVIREKVYKRNYPLYCLRWYDPHNKRSMKDVYIIKNNSIFFKIKSIEKVSGSKKAYCVEVNNHEPYFTLPSGLITHNCRLISNNEMLEYASQSNSFGAGGSVSLGSHRICTINFMRIFLESKNKEDFFKILDSRIEDAAKILKAHKELLYELTDKGLQPFISIGWITLSRMFSTYGIIGIYEAAKNIKECSESTNDIESEILIHLNNKVKEMSEKYDIIGNIEQIPAESFAIRFAEADKVLYNNKVPYELYSNQFIPLWENATIWERLDKDGKYNKLITGGGIVHAQIGEKVTAKQAEKIIKYAINSGAEHFALNSIYSECEDGHTTFGDSNKCPLCAKEIIEKYTRIVGFFTPVSSWQKTRREWEFPKRTFVNIE